MNTVHKRMRILVVPVLLFMTAGVLQAGGHHSKPRDIDRALLITDIVLRSLFPTRVVVESQPVVTYTTPYYETTTMVVTTPSMVVSPVFSHPVYVRPTVRYTRPSRYDHCRPSPRWYTPSRRDHHQWQPKSQPSLRKPNKARNDRKHRR